MKLSVVVFLFLFISVASFAQVAVIVNKSVGEKGASAQKLADIYLLKTMSWANGKKIVVIDQSGNSDTKAKFYSHMGQEALALKKVWLKKQLTGEAKAPESVNGDAEVIAKVASTPGAIGYVKESSVTSEVSVLTIIK